MLTGLQTPDNRMFENADVPWVKNLSLSIPTIGHMLRKAGYYTAYKGKRHLNSKFDSEKPSHFFTKEMEAYGFADYIGHTLGGYQFDPLIGGSAGTWLRRNGCPLADERKPSCLFVSRAIDEACRPRAGPYAVQDDLGRAAARQPDPAFRCAGTPESP